MKLALVGATGMVGNVMLKVLEERNFPAADLFAVASKNSIGKVISFKNKNVTVIGIEQALENSCVRAAQNSRKK